MFYNKFTIEGVIIIEQKNNVIVTKEKSNIENYDIENIKNLIYTIRGKQVMLDSDVAMLYHYETKKINQTVKRNIERFPEKFCFQLTENELEDMWSQFVTASKMLDNKFRNKKYLPYAFTEQGIAMLSGLLRNQIAVQVSINIMDAFVEMRKFIASNGQVFKEINTIKGKLLEQDARLLSHDEKFDLVFDELQKGKKEEFKQKVFFDGQIYDSYSLIIDIIKTAKNKILIIDNYIDDSILKMLAKKNKDAEVVILTSQNSNIKKLDIQKFNKQYGVLKLAYTNKFHDIFMVIDNTDLYHIGASLKDLGKKCFAISKIEDMGYIEKLKSII